MDADWSLAVRPTPLHHRTSELSRTNRWTDRLGWTLPEVYDGVEAEHTALRNACGISDRSALATYRIKGADAPGYLNRLTGGNGGETPVGRTQRVVLCEDDGAMIADGLVIHPEGGEYLLTLPCFTLEWLLTSAEGFDVEVADASDEIATIGVEGPTACAALLSAGFGGLEALRPGAVRKATLGQTEVTVARVSPSGDLGYELRVPSQDGLWLYDRVRRDAREFNMVPVGEAALRLARLEAGHAVFGTDYVGALTTTSGRRSPLALGLRGLVDLEGPYFTGKTALLRERKAGAEQALVGLTVEGEDVLPDSAVLFGGDPAGRVTSMAWSPTIKRVIALAEVSAAGLGASAPLSLRDAHGASRKANIVARPFFAPKRAKRTPPSAF